MDKIERDVRIKLYFIEKYKCTEINFIARRGKWLYYKGTEKDNINFCKIVKINSKGDIVDISQRDLKIKLRKFDRISLWKQISSDLKNLLLTILFIISEIILVTIIIPFYILLGLGNIIETLLNKVIWEWKINTFLLKINNELCKKIQG